MQGTEPTKRSVAELGRYRILGQLAVGGMAEILLARLVGPNGFERPVVIKRILPHLANVTAFVDMFIDEARIAAGIDHPNVVHVHELGRDDDELYLVMEYLEGENLGGILRRATRDEARLPFWLVAHVLAEACAGLHAAHELKDPDGMMQYLVHRDVSPQNILVTYAGQVKVLDFGIAKATDRITRTEAGQVKGKFEYMSPEQCLSKPLDRRSDVFALGAVLYELGTGHRLFRRASELKTLEAICYDPVQPPATIDPTFPDDLARICMRALARRPADRYDTAGDMRRDLLAVVRTRTNSEDPHEALARWMEARFADRIEEKRLLLQRWRSAPGPTYLPAAEVDAEIEVPVVVDDGGSATASAVTRPTPSATRGPRAALVIVGVAAVVATLGLVAMSWRSDPASANATTVATTTVSPTAIVTAASIATDRLHGTQVTPVPETSAAPTPSASSSASARQIGRPPVRRPPTNGTTRDFGRFD